jgi:hypothetical protein
MRLGVREKEWKYTAAFDLIQSGYSIRKLGSKVVFLHVARYNAPQRLVSTSSLQMMIRTWQWQVINELI